MFNKLMSNFYYGKSGKGDFTQDDLPENRWQLFWDTLRTRFSALVRLNLMYVVIWIPTIIVCIMLVSGGLNVINQMDLGDGTSYQSRTAQELLEDQANGTLNSNITQEQLDTLTQAQPVLSDSQVRDSLQSLLFMTLLMLVPCISITGPATAGVCYVTQHWSRDEHAFIWSDFKDAVKENWKQSLGVSVITGFVPLLVYVAWHFYGGMAENQALMVIPQVLVLMLGIIWMISVTYMHPMIVSYHLSFKDVLRNSILIAIARLPMSVGIRLLHCIPVALAAAGAVFISTQWAPMILLLYYVLLGYSLSRFITASYTNGVFDRFINAQIEGAPVNRGLREADEEEEEDSEEE